MALPKQWKLITLYMVLAYLAFVVSIEIARHQVIAEEKAATTQAMPGEGWTEQP